VSAESHGLAAPERRYPETRIGAFDFSEATGTEVLGYASGSPHRASIDSCREVAADLGLYSQPDPIGLDGGLNLFAYANGSPTGYTDSFGLQGLPSGSWAVPAVAYAARACAERIKEESKGLQDRRRGPGELPHWPYVHCVVNCRIKKECGATPLAGTAIAWAGSLVKEFGDVYDCYRTGFNAAPGGSCFSAFQPYDFEANRTGRQCPPESDCMRHCEAYDVQDSADKAGPFIWLLRQQALFPRGRLH
jgi:hypothetical protein